VDVGSERKEEDRQKVAAKPEWGGSRDAHARRGLGMGNTSRELLEIFFFHFFRKNEMGNLFGKLLEMPLEQLQQLDFSLSTFSPYRGILFLTLNLQGKSVPAA